MHETFLGWNTETVYPRILIGSLAQTVEGLSDVSDKIFVNGFEENLKTVIPARRSKGSLFCSIIISVAKKRGLSDFKILLKLAP